MKPAENKIKRKENENENEKLKENNGKLYL
jgi:hypothetical protein